MTAKQRSFNRDLSTHYLQRIASDRAFQIRLAPRTYGRHIWDGTHRPRFEFQRCVTDDVVYLALLREQDRHAVTAKDPGFLPGNFSNGISQEFLVIERNVRDHAHARFNHVGRVEASSHADFEDGDVHFFAGKIFEGHGGKHFKKTGMPGQFAFRYETLSGAVDHVMQQGEFVIAYG